MGIASPFAMPQSRWGTHAVCALHHKAEEDRWFCAPALLCHCLLSWICVRAAPKVCSARYLKAMPQLCMAPFALRTSLVNSLWTYSRYRDTEPSVSLRAGQVAGEKLYRLRCTAAQVLPSFQIHFYQGVKAFLHEPVCFSRVLNLYVFLA